jgi:hypothetical protein
VAPDLTRAWVVVAVLLAACGDEEDDAAPATTTEAPATSTTSTTEPPSSTTTTTCPPLTGDPPISTVDLDRDGVDELWRSAGSGASTDIVELHRIDGCVEVPVTLDGINAQFAIGGSVLLLQGLRCEPGRLVHLGATSEDGENYATLDIVYELRGGALQRVDESTGDLTTADPELADYSTFDC